MKTLVIQKKGEHNRLVFAERPIPVIEEHEILIRVFSAGVNRADLLQVRGLYPAPRGWPQDVPGLECAGFVEQSGCEHFSPGERVCALLGGGGYSEYVRVPCGVCFRVPEPLSFVEAGAFPEVYLTAFHALFECAHIKKGDKVLIHAGASGLGTACLHLALSVGAEVYVTTRHEEKLQACLQLGARMGWNPLKTNFSDAILEETNGEGIDIIVDPVGASYFQQNLRCIKTDGRWVLLGLLGGVRVPELLLSEFLQKRLQFISTTLRHRPLSFKEKLIQNFLHMFRTQWEAGTFRPALSKIFHWKNVEKAHQWMRENRLIGKVVLRVLIDEDLST